MSPLQSAFAFFLLPVSAFHAAFLPYAAQAQTLPSDLQGHWAKSCMQTLAQKGTIAPPINGAYRPNDLLTRAEYAALMQRAFPKAKQVQKAIRFRDMQPGSPTARAAQYIQQTGFLLSDRSDEFRPWEPVTRSQSVGGIANGLGYTVKSPAAQNLQSTFRDGQMVPDYAVGAVSAALENGLIVNPTNLQQFNPNEPIRRAELAATLCRVSPTTSNLVPMQYVARVGNRPIVIDNPVIGNPVVGNPGVPINVPFPSPSPIVNAPSPKPIPLPKPNTPGSVVIPIWSTPLPKPGQLSRPGGVIIGGPTTPNPGSVVIPISTPSPGLDSVFAPPQIPTQEIRAAWITNVDSDVLFNSQSLQNAINELARLKFNTVYPVVWNWGYTLYPSAVAQRATGAAIDPREAGLTNRDPLAELVQHGRRHNIAIVPWFEFGFMAPSYSELAKRHPEWLTQRKDGTTIWQEGEHPRVWLNPFHPEVQQFTLDLISEIVSKDGVDGIQFDDHMGLPSEFGYDPYTIALYKTENNGKEPPANPKDPAWLRWRADKITDFMGRVFRVVKAQKPNATVALSPNSQQFSYENYLQDWVTWQRRGYVEELMVQIYRTDPTSYTNELMQPELQEARQAIPVGVGILTGLKNKSVPMSIIEQKIQIARDRGFSGFSFFFYETMWNLADEPGDQRKASFQQLFAPPVTRPNKRTNWTAQP
jgi:uncharacterized lipoprotein YddW (UPF0748 family)